MSRTERIAAINAEIVELERIVAAPRRLVELRSHREDLLKRDVRDAELAAARETDPGYDRKLAEARDRVVELQAEVADHERRRLAKPDDDKLLEAGVQAANASFASIPLVKGVVGARFLPPPTHLHRAALESLEEAKNRVKVLERWPRNLAFANAPENRPAGETNEQRILTARHVPIGTGWRNGSRFRRDKAEAETA